MKYLKLVRWQNLLMLAATQLIIKYYLFEPFNIAITLNDFGFALLVISTLFLAAGGNVINDIFDREIDIVNQPKKQLIGKNISEKTGYNLFLVFNIIGVGIGFYLSNLIQRPEFAAIFIGISALLYLYSSYIKSYAVVGNLLISVLVAMSIIVVGIFDLMPAITTYNQQSQLTLFSILLDYAIFAFLINFIREIVKDQQDINGDYKAGLKTLPILLGQERVNKIVFALLLLPLAASIYYIYTYLYAQTLAVIYVLVLIVAPLLYGMVRIWTAKTPKNYQLISTILKMILVFGILSLTLYQFILQ